MKQSETTIHNMCESSYYIVLSVPSYELIENFVACQTALKFGGKCFGSGCLLAENKDNNFIELIERHVHQ